MATWYLKLPPRAWEAQERARPKAPTATIPNIESKEIRKSLWFLKPPKRLKRFNESCETIAHKSLKLQRMHKSFTALKRSSKHIKRSADVAYLAEHAAKNRNSNRFVFDLTRSCQDVPGFYINANDIQTPLQTYMVTQGPLDYTVDDFWRAVLHKKSPVIVTLVMAIEQGNEKCASYWTIDELTVDEWTISLKGEKLIATSALIPNHRIIERTFIAKKNNEERIVKQVHYENWPDGKIPELELFIKLLDEVDSLTSNPKAPITVHCSAGIGRSGTFVAAHSLRKEIRQRKQTLQKKQELSINIPKAVYLLRLQRMGLVGSSRQYQTVYQTIAREHQPRSSPCFLL